MRITRCGALALALSLGSVSYGQTIIPLGGGWQASVNNPSLVSFVVDEVTSSYIAIQISKDFTQPPGIGGVFPPLLIDFQQVNPDATTVTQIVINDETVTNLTGTPWTDFHWAVLDNGDAWFDIAASSSFTVLPFTNRVFSDPSNTFADPNKASDLDAFGGGIVPHGGSFFPGGAPGDGVLVMGVDLTRPDPMSFTLKEFPTPEPGSLALMSAGALMLLRRRK